MGSGVLLAILVALWFVVLVPMVVTRGDLATTPAEPMRVLRRRSERSAMSSSAMSSSTGSSAAGSTAGGSTSAGSSSAGASKVRTSRAGSTRAVTSSDRALRAGAVRGPQAASMRTEPIPALPRRVPGASLPSEASLAGARPVDAAGAGPSDAKPSMRDVIARGEVDIRRRRRRMLTGLVALTVLWALFATFWQPVLWWPQILLDLILFSYIVVLRLEAQREQDRQERRRARAATRVKLPEDRTERQVRKRAEYQSHVTAATRNQSISLDDDDPSFAELPTWDPNEAPAWHERKAV